MSTTKGTKPGAPDWFTLDVVFEHREAATGKMLRCAEEYVGRFDTEEFAHQAARSWVARLFPSSGHVLSVTTKYREVQQ